jgi:Protein of unknown function (DUF3592)
MKAHPLEILARMVFVGVAFILLGFAVWMSYDNLTVINTHEKALAEVISSERVGPSSSKGLNWYSVRLQFEKDGKMRKVEIGRSRINYDPGDVIPIYYLEETGYKGVAGDFWGMWFFVIVVAFPGIIFLVVGLIPGKKMRHSQA